MSAPLSAAMSGWKKPAQLLLRALFLGLRLSLILLSSFHPSLLSHCPDSVWVLRIGKTRRRLSQKPRAHQEELVLPRTLLVALNQISSSSSGPEETVVEEPGSVFLRVPGTIQEPVKQEMGFPGWFPSSPA